MEHPRGSSRLGRLVRLGFAEPALAVVELEQLGLWSDDGPVDEPSAAVVAALAQAPDPDLATRSLARLSAATGDPAELLDQLRGHDGLRRRLLAVLGTSVAFGDHLATHPDDWRALVDDVLTISRPSRLGMQQQLLDAVGAPARSVSPTGTTGARASGDGPAVLRSLRAAYRRCLLVLAARDLSGVAAVEDVAGELADLAAATLSAGLAVALAGLPDGAEPCRLAVIGMGKCGGRELNYVSDVVSDSRGGGRLRAALAGNVVGGVRGNKRLLEAAGAFDANVVAKIRNASVALALVEADGFRLTVAGLENEAPPSALAAEALEPSKDIACDARATVGGCHEHPLDFGLSFVELAKAAAADRSAVIVEGDEDDRDVVGGRRRPRFRIGSAVALGDF